MEFAERLARMDLNMVEMYREMTRVTPGGAIVERAGLTMCATPLGTITTNMAIVTGAVDVATVRAETAAVFDGRPFSLWTRAHCDGPLEDALRCNGWFDVTSSPGMCFAPGDGAPVPPPDGVALRWVRSDADRAAFAAVAAAAYAVYGAPEASTAAFFARLDSLVSPVARAVLAWEGDAAVAGAILYLTHGIGGVGWVGTRPTAFGRGLGAAVTSAVIAEGLRERVPLLSLQASPMGEPVYRRLGFSSPTAYRMFIATG